MKIMNLKLERIRQGIRQMDLAAQIGISETRLSKIETGRAIPTQELIKKIAEALGILIPVSGEAKTLKEEGVIHE